MILISEGTKNFIKYANIPIAPIGTIFNLIAFAVFSRKKFKTHKIAFYTKINLITHSLTLNVFFVHFLFLLQDIEPLLVSNFLCKFNQLLQRLFMHLSSWIEIIITFDRNNNIRMRNNSILRDKRSIARTITVTTCVIFLLNTPNLAFRLVDLQTMQNSSSYGRHSNISYLSKFCLSEPFVIILRDVFTQFVGIYIPCVSIVIMNVTLFRDLKDLSPSQPSTTTTTRDKRERSFFKKEINYGMTIFALNVFFLITHLPMAIFTIAQTSGRYFFNFQQLTQTKIDNIYWIYSITQYILAFYYSMTFWFNLWFNKLFYEEFLLLLKEIRFMRTNRNARELANNNVLMSNGSVLIEKSSCRPNFYLNQSQVNTHNVINQ